MTEILKSKYKWTAFEWHNLGNEIPMFSYTFTNIFGKCFKRWELHRCLLSIIIYLNKIQDLKSLY